MSIASLLLRFCGGCIPKKVAIRRHCVEHAGGMGKRELARELSQPLHGQTSLPMPPTAMSIASLLLRFCGVCDSLGGYLGMESGVARSSVVTCMTT